MTTRAAPEGALRGSRGTFRFDDKEYAIIPTYLGRVEMVGANSIAGVGVEGLAVGGHEGSVGWRVERAILAGVVSETTATLVQDREAQWRALRERLAALEARRGTGPLRVDARTITAQLARLNELLGRDVARANAFFRAHVGPIICAPVREGGQKFYRATVAAKGAEIIKSLGLVPQAFDLGGCGGPL